MEKSKNLIVGLWKFHDRVIDKDLIDVANEWAKDDNYTRLYIRKTSTDQVGIGFEYIYDGTKEGQSNYNYTTSDYLKRKFGNDLVGWDFAPTDQLIKGY